MFIELKSRATRPETLQYRKWEEKRKADDFKFREVLPFGGVVQRGGGTKKFSRDNFEKMHPDEMGNVLFNPENSWNQKKMVG